MVQYGPAEPSLRAHRIARFRSHPRLCWDLFSILELQGRAGCRRCVHLLGKRNGYHSQFKWADAVGGLNSHLARLQSMADSRAWRSRRREKCRAQARGMKPAMSAIGPLLIPYLEKSLVSLR